MALGTLNILNNSKIEEDIQDLQTKDIELSNSISSLQTPTFTQASSRSNINSGESYTTIFGKIKKYFFDLKSHAFNNPVNNLTTTTTGYALDASQGKVLNDRINSIGSIYESKLSSDTNVSFNGMVCNITIPTGVYIIEMRVRGDYKGWLSENGTLVEDITNYKYMMCLGDNLALVGNNNTDNFMPVVTKILTCTGQTTYGICNGNGKSVTYTAGTYLRAVKIK